MQRRIEGRSGPFQVFWWAALGTCIVLLLAHYFRFDLGHDQAVHLVEARRLLAGAQLYGPQLQETNPPVIIWFSCIPVWLGAVLGVSASVVFRALVALLLFGSLAWSLRVVRAWRSGLHGLVLLLLAAGLAWSELLIGPADFGQREHLMILFSLPYMLRLATSSGQILSVWERWALGLCAALGVWLKPQEVIAVLALQGFVCARARSLRPCLSPEFLGLLTGCFGTLCLVLGAAPLYTRQIVPLLLQAYWAFGTDSTLALVQRSFGYLALVFALFAVCYAVRERLPQAPGAAALLFASLGASLAFDVQHTRWRYHLYPQRALLLVAVTCLMASLLNAWLAMRKRRVVPAERMATGICLLALLLCAVVAMRGVPVQAATPQYAALDGFLGRCPPGTVVTVLSTGVRDLGLVEKHRLVWGSRFAHLWLLPALVKNAQGPLTPREPFKRLPSAVLQQLSADQHRASAEDLHAWHPAWVLVRRCVAPMGCDGLPGRRFDTLSWLLQDPQFAQEWSHYRQRPAMNGYDVYQRVP